ncbi:MAG: hypothetical protein WD738_14270 [Pirellulales bacterium]
MGPYLLTDVMELGENEELAGRSECSPPESFNRRKTSQRTRKRARRSRSNNMAKRGIHQRRNKRSAW